MSRVITFSRVFPSYHPRKGEETFFVEKILNGIAPKMHSGVVDLNLLSDEVKSIINDFVLLCSSDDIKGHTIRAGNRWKVGDWFSPRVWSGAPYKSKQIIIAPDIQIKKIWDIEIELGDRFQIMKPKDNQEWYLISNGDVAKNDGLEYDDFVNWFNAKPKKQYDMLKAQIICWNENINY
ncbi:MAG TPA: hypothetical protein PK431_10695 [Chitinophagales bacterium]|nr:hypothetical protein [Chitinophagales bacterium]